MAPTDRGRATAGATSAVLLSCVLVLGGCGSSPQEDSRSQAAGGMPDTTGPASPVGPGAASASSSASSSAGTPSSSAGTPPSDTSGGGGSSDNAPSGSPGSSGAGTGAGASAPPSVASEVDPNAPEPPEEAGLTGLAPAPTGPLVTRPLPRPGTAQGRLVAGFPSKVVAPMPGSDIGTSAVTSQGRRLQATLTATTPRPVDRVLLHFRVRLGRLGFVEESAPVGATEIRFTRGASTATVTATPTLVRTSYAVITTLHAG